MRTHELLQQKFKELLPRLEEVAAQLDEVEDLEGRIKLEQAALLEVQTRRDAAKKQHDQEMSRRKAEIASLQQAQEREAAQLKGVQDHITTTKAELAELRSQVNSATYHRDKALESIQALTRQINGAA
jgi:chromosome segregation ATPase